jgi:hypothetical protein
MDIKLNKNGHSNKIDLNSEKITINNDIEEILSGTYSHKSDKNIDLKINKVDTKQKIKNLERDIKDKIELSSQKEVDIGLDLLVNNQKKNTKSNDESSISSPINNAFNLNNDIISIENTSNNSLDKLDNLISNLNMDKTSRLSQQEIDAIIDKQDSREPVLLDSLEVESIINDNKDIKSQTNVLNIPNDNSYPNNGNSYPNNGYTNNNYQHQFVPREDPLITRRKKQETLFKLEKMRRLGIQGIKKFNMSSDVNEMEDELNRVKQEREIENSVKFQRKCLMAFVTGSELVNNKLDFLNFQLDGWSEQVHENINDYNEVFEELHEKYKEKAQIAPEFKLLFMLGGSAFMYHLTNSMFKNSVPGMEDIMKQNPELMKQFANAAINQMQGEEKQAAEIFNNYAPNNRGPPPNRGRQMPPNMGRQMPPNMGRQMPPNMGRQMPPNMGRQMPTSPPPRHIPINTHHNSEYVSINDPLPNIATSSLVSDHESVKIMNKIEPPRGVDEILDELRSNTDQISEVISQSSKSRKINISNKKRRRPKRNINLTIN